MYTTTSTKLLQDPKVQTALANYLVDQLYTNVDVQTEIEQALPERLKPLAGPAATALRPYAVKGAERLLASPAAQGLWKVANRNAHERFVVLVTSGDNGRAVQHQRQRRARPPADPRPAGRRAGERPAGGRAAGGRRPDRDHPVRHAGHGADDHPQVAAGGQLPVDHHAGALRAGRLPGPGRPPLGRPADRLRRDRRGHRPDHRPPRGRQLPRQLAVRLPERAGRLGRRVEHRHRAADQRERRRSSRSAS